MGYRRTGHHLQRLSSDDDRSCNEKTMEESIATAPTLHSGNSLKAEEDDATTIRSVDSLSAPGLLLNLTDETDDEQFDSMTGGHYISTLPGHAAEATSTCSVSTAPSTDEASSLGDWASFSNESAAARLGRLQQPEHRVPSWEASPHSQYSPGESPSQPFHLPPSTYSPPSGWGPNQQQPQVATFRTEGYPPRATQHTPPRYHGATGNDPSLPYLPPNMGNTRQDRHGYNRQGGYHYHLPLQRRHQPPLPPSNLTPPRNAHEQRGTRVATRGATSPRAPQSPGSGARSASEILKTLLRKKACLYEPETSRAVALVTWLIGRELAIAQGYFSRQQLQAGVHACVASKIESGAITRTKVNRCMQIILNSCFHYIIPRPDGTEESGESFRAVFSAEMKDDRPLLATLAAPWNDLTVDSKMVLLASTQGLESPKKSAFETPDSSPKLGSINEKHSPGRDSHDGSEARRAVLLCFNDNVRSAEDVFRCHNEFIRDTARSCNLQLSSNEWKQFFGREAANTWGNIGISVPSPKGKESRPDALGVMRSKEVGCFRTSWCSKRYDHDHELCGFAHAEINGGWLRRDPTIHNYKDEICSFITSNRSATRGGVKGSTLIMNECPKGVHCEFAHSVEEVIYHPKRYKQRICSSAGRVGGCHLGDVCPNHHPAESYRFPKKSDSRSPRHARQAPGNTSPAKGPVVTGSPILYASPAPVSGFDDLLMMPGLKNLFRRNCAVIRKLARTGNSDNCLYQPFGDDAGIVLAPGNSQVKKAGKPSRSVGV